MVAVQAPMVILSPLAGVLADRWDRRTAMIVSDLGAGLAVLAAAILYLTQRLQPWMVIPINLWMASFGSLMWPAYTASVSLLVPREQYGRANGIVQLGEAIPQIAGPAIAGALYVIIRLGNMALIDFATYVFAVVLMIVLVRIPKPPVSTESPKIRESMWQEVRFGWRYIRARPGLLRLLMYFFSLNFLFGIMQPLFVPLILDNWDASVLGYVSTVLGVGMLAGTLVMSAWGGTRRKVYTLLGAGVVQAFFMAAFGLRASIPLLAVCGFGFMFVEPMMNASSQAIWQSKVAPDVQGRVFGVRRMIAWSAQIAAPLLAAPLADHVFKPALVQGGSLAPILGPVFGTGASRGVGLMISLLGVLMFGVAIAGFGSSRIRNVELDLPDHAVSAAAVPSIGEPAN
jgi:MFS family permease